MINTLANESVRVGGSIPRLVSFSTCIGFELAHANFFDEF